MHYRTYEDLMEIIEENKPENVIRIFWRESELSKLYEQYLENLNIISQR